MGDVSIQGGQWIHHHAWLDDGREVTPRLYRQIHAEELASIRERIGDARWAQGFAERAAALFETMTLRDELADFLTIPAYEGLLKFESSRL